MPPTIIQSRAVRCYNPERPAWATDRQWIFVLEYLVHLSPTRAARAAGYMTPTVDGSRLLNEPRVGGLVRRALERRAERLEITADAVLRELAKLGFANMDDYSVTDANGDKVPDLSNATRDQMAAITSLEVEEYMEGRGDDARAVKRTKFKLADKRAALVDIGKHLGMFKERVEVSGPGGGPVPLVVAQMTPKQAAEAYALSLSNPSAVPTIEHEPSEPLPDDDIVDGQDSD